MKKKVKAIKVVKPFFFGILNKTIKKFDGDAGKAAADFYLQTLETTPSAKVKFLYHK